MTADNGWSKDPPTQAISIDRQSTNVREGIVRDIFQLFLNSYNSMIEPVVTLHGYRTSATNAAVGGSPRSNHVSGTAIDVNGNKHPYEPQLRPGVRYSHGFTTKQLISLRGILAVFDNTIQWGGDYPAPFRDAMHFQIRKGVSAERLRTVYMLITKEDEVSEVKVTVENKNVDWSAFVLAQDESDQKWWVINLQVGTKRVGHRSVDTTLLTSRGGQVLGGPQPHSWIAAFREV